MTNFPEPPPSRLLTSNSMRRPPSEASSATAASIPLKVVANADASMANLELASRRERFSFSASPMDSAQRRDWQTGLASGVRDEVVVNALLEDERTPNPRRRDNVIWATMVDFFLVDFQTV